MFTLKKIFGLSKKLQLYKQPVHVEGRDIIHLLPERFKDIPGMITDQMGTYLHLLARTQTINGTIVEIGSWQGKSTAYLASSISHRGEQMIAIDHFQGNPGKEKLYIVNSDDLSDIQENFWNNLKRHNLDKKVILYNQNSSEVATVLKKNKIKIRLLFIDGCHDYEAVKADFFNFIDMVVEDGFIVFDDYSQHFPGVLRLVGQIQKKSIVNDCFFLPNTCVMQKK